ncbi:MAG: aminotransferase class I/II-fold pyridoxal phosphate-dependent enzyme [Ilumatobacteraceae bacterium]
MNATAPTAADLDAIPIEALRASGSLKWTRFDGDVIGAFVAEMDFGTAPAVTAALHEAVDATTFGYLPDALSRAMSEACAAWQSTTYGWNVDADDVHPLPDVIRGLTAAIEHFSTPGSKVVLPTPAYMPFFTVPATMGREIIEVPMAHDADGRHRFDLDGIGSAFDAGGGLLVLCNPHNPVGRVYERDELAALSQVVDAHSGRVFADEIHSPLVFPPHRHVPYASVSDVAASHAVTATSASKAWNLPGLKCAQLIISNDADAALWGEVGLVVAHGASNLGVVATTAAFASGGEWLGGILDYLDGSRLLLADLLAEHLPAIGYAPPEGTYLTWLDCRGLGLGDAPAEVFQERGGVVLVDGVRCGGPGYVRLNIATPRPVLGEIVARMARAVG